MEMTMLNTGKPIEKEEYKKVNKTFEELQKEVEEGFSSNQFKEKAIRDLLKRRPVLRKTYLALVLINPARIGELIEKTFNQKRTQYAHLYELLEFNLIKKVSVMQVEEKKRKGEELSEDEEMVLSKFNDWTSKMSDGMKSNFKGKTHYWTLSEFGKNLAIIDFALFLDKKMREGEK